MDAAETTFCKVLPRILEVKLFKTNSSCLAMAALNLAAF